MKRTGPASELIRMFFALVQANREILQKERFENFTFENADEARIYKRAYRDGAIEALRKLEEQLLITDELGGKK